MFVNIYFYYFSFYFSPLLKICFVKILLFFIVFIFAYKISWHFLKVFVCHYRMILLMFVCSDVFYRIKDFKNYYLKLKFFFWSFWTVIPNLVQIREKENHILLKKYNNKYCSYNFSSNFKINILCKQPMRVCRNIYSQKSFLIKNI